MKKTRVNFENYLNDCYPTYKSFMAYLCTNNNRVKSALNRGRYGSMLRKHDPIAFELEYKYWTV